VKVLWALLATVVAVAAQTTIDRWFSNNAIDLVLVVVVYNALSTGRVGGMLTGSFAGLVQDTLSGGVIGMAGLSKTIVGFGAGIVGTQFIVTHSASRFVVFFLATVVNAAIFMGLYELLGLRHFGTPVVAVAGQGLGNAVVGVLAPDRVQAGDGALARETARRPGHNVR